MTSGPIAAFLEVKQSTPYRFVTRAGAQDVQTFQDQGFIGYSDNLSPNIPILGYYNAIKNSYPDPGLGTVNAAWSATNGSLAANLTTPPASGGDFDFSMSELLNLMTRNPYAITLTASAANAEIKQTTTWPSGSFSVRGVWAVHNRAAAARTFQPTIGGSNAGSAVSIPAGQLVIVRSDPSAFSASQRVLGLKVTNSVASEAFDIWWLAAPATSTSTPVAPLPPYITERAKDGFATQFDGPGWVGTAYDSNFQGDPSFWLIPLTADIFDAGQGEIIIDAAAPFPVGAAAYHPLFIIGSKGLLEASSGLWYKDRFYAQINPGGASGIVVRHDTSTGTQIETVNANPAISLSAAKARHTYFVSWDPARWGCSVDNATPVYNKRSSVDEAWPFNATLVPDPVLHVGSRQDFPSSNMQATMFYRGAIASRPLTAAERTYLADPTSVYAINMLAVPHGANLSDSMTTWNRGDTQHVDIEIIDANGFPVALYGTTIWLTIKPADTDLVNDSDATLKAYIVLSNTGAITGSNLLELIDANDGWLRFSIGTTEANLFTAGTVYKWDIQGKSVGGDIRTCRQGQLTIQPEVTRRTTTP